MRLRDVLSVLFAIFVLLSASYVAFISVDPPLGYPWSVLVAGMVLVGALGILNNKLWRW
jgi:hypothetical protein